MAAAMVTCGGSPVLACPACFGAEESSLIDGTKLGILALLAITLSVQGAFVGFFLYLRRRAKRMADLDLDTEWSELQQSRTPGAPRSDAARRIPPPQPNLRGWGPAGPQAR
jgi:hypothetical protein